ncbi:MAG: hypothetical protein EZS28_054088, partial [Streblomastix strix]
NALYGTEQESITGNIEDLLVDYDLLTQYRPYYSDIIYLSTTSIGKDRLYCGKIDQPCNTPHYSRTKVETPEWTSSTIQTRSEITTQKVYHTYVAIEEIKISEQFWSESDIVTIRGVLREEREEGKNYAKVLFIDNGQIVCSDLAHWQTILESDNKGVDQKLIFKHLSFILQQIINQDIFLNLQPKAFLMVRITESTTLL